MTLEEFLSSVESDEPPTGISPELQSLWYAKKGEWHASHDIAQDIPSSVGSWIHALLHTIEGDLGNAGYWYARAGKPAISMSQIDEEWESIAVELLASV